MNEGSCTGRYRLFGFLFFFLFAARYVELASRQEIPHILWVCHMSSLVIALGFFFCRIEFIRISVLWLIIGAPIWPIEIIRTGIVELTSIGTHYLALLIALFVIVRQGMGKHSWLYASIWFLFLQQITRWVTPAELNINLAHAVYPGWERSFPAYWQYWIFTTGCSIMSLWLISKLLARLSKRRQQWIEKSPPPFSS